ncbi:hypothetical protein CFFPNG_00694 [Methylorubrum aminovorans]
MHDRIGALWLYYQSHLILETNLPAHRFNARYVTLAAVAALLALSTAACATKPPPVPDEPTPLCKEG